MAATALAVLSCNMLKAQEPPYNERYRYIEVTGTSEVEIVPDEIHFIIGIKEYFEESSTEYPNRNSTRQKSRSVPSNPGLGMLFIR